ncbi:MAG: hypothetical protein HFH87_08390 [Lachnospiraceae bacterium]|nr:hypothetical protein [Lachnospiraceae bacterium]
MHSRERTGLFRIVVKRAEWRLGGPYAESLEPALEFHARPVYGGQIAVSSGRSLARACVMGTGDGCMGIK